MVPNFGGAWCWSERDFAVKICAFGVRVFRGVNRSTALDGWLGGKWVGRLPICRRNGEDDL